MGTLSDRPLHDADRAELDPGRPAWLADLLRPEAYPHPVETVDLLQTHVSWLFFAGERVYKVKKPVDLGFLDFTTLERRRHFCGEEVRLNRRLTPDVHLGVVPLVEGENGRRRIGARGEVDGALDFAVEMVRLPDGRMLERLLERGEIDNQRMNELAERLSAFHRAAPTGEGVDEFGTPEAIRVNEAENFEQLAPFVAGTAAEGLDVLSARQFDFLRARRLSGVEARTELFERRIREGRVRDGHGDLHAGNIGCLEDGLRIIDCIEFNRRFRCADVAADLAFLTMDLDRRGYPSFARYLVRRYAELAEDPELPEVLDFYRGYRAIVRGKVAAFTAADPGCADRPRQRRRAMALLQLATAYELPPTLILMCGLSASGKSWLARRLARPLRATVLQSDVRRKTLVGLTPRTSVPEDFEVGLYSPERKRLTYQSLLDGALVGLEAGHSVVVDATFTRREYRQPFIDAAVRAGLPYTVVWVTAPEDVIAARLERRAQDPHESSDADWSVYVKQRDTFEPPDEVPDGRLLEVVSGDQPPEEQSAVVIDGMIALQGRG